MKFLHKIFNNIKKNKEWYRKLVLIFFFGALLLVYLLKITRDVYSGDIGDLVTAAWVFGVAHPPGYPLFTFLGYLFSHYLPVALPPVSKVAIISVLASWIGLIFIYKFAFRVTKNFYLSLLSTSILAFSYLYWIQAEIPEVFALNNLFIILILYYSILFYEEKKAKHLYILVFLCGLSLTHHQTVLLLFPSVLILTARHFKFVFWNWRRLLIMTGLFLIGLLPYLYVPIAASQNPILNWNNATNVDNFIKLVLRLSYGDFAPNIFILPLELKFLVVKHYIQALVSNFSYQIVFVFFLGILYLGFKQKILAISLAIGFLLSGPFFVFYAAPLVSNEVYLGIIERFYVFSSIIFMLIVVYGLLAIKILLSIIFKHNLLYSNILLLYFIIIPLFLFIYNNPKTDLSKTTIGNNLVIDMFSSIPRNSVLTVSGDTQTFNTWYMSYVLKYRKDVDIVNSIGIGSNVFYEREKNKYKRKNPKVKESDLYQNTFEQLREKRKIFFTFDQRYSTRGTILVPKGLVLEVIDREKIPSKTDYEKEITKILSHLHVPIRNKLKSYDDNLITSEIPGIYSEAFIKVGNFFSIYYKDPIKATYYYKKALDIDDEYHSAYANYGLNIYNKSKDCRGSINYINKAIELYPIQKDYYLLLYNLYKDCKISKSNIYTLNKVFKSRYKEDIETALKIGYKSGRIKSN